MLFVLFLIPFLTLSLGAQATLLYFPCFNEWSDSHSSYLLPFENSPSRFNDTSVAAYDVLPDHNSHIWIQLPGDNDNSQHLRLS